MKTLLKNTFSRCVSATVLLAALLPFSAAQAANPSGDLKIEIISAYNLVVDSNVTTPATYAPTAATLGAKFCNTGSNDLTDVQAYIGDFSSKIPGTYPARNSTDAAFQAEHPHLANTGSYFFTHESGSFSSVTDASRAWIGTLKPGECRTEYWVVSYPQCANVDDGSGKYIPQPPPCTTSVTGGSGLEDDLWLTYDVWATAKDDGGATSLTADDSRKLTMRSELSASANKIWPNGDNKVPDEYKQVIEEALGWDTWSSSGIDGVAYPGNTVRTQGIWYDFGNANQGFDNNGDLVPDQNAWAQPIGNPSLYDPGCFRMVRTYGLLIVKLKDGGEKLIPFVDQLYFENIPDNTGVVGLVFYEFVALNGTCSGTLSPYQEVASGRDNEKFSADYGAPLPPMMTQSPKAYIDKTASPTSIASGSGPVTYTLEVTNPNKYTDSLNNPYTLSIGNPELGVPLVIREKVPEGSVYELNSAKFIANTDGVTKSGLILYSADGVTWTAVQPATASDIKYIEWRLDEPLTSDDGAHENTMKVEFKATMPTNGYTAPVISNTGCAAFGSGPCFAEDDADVLIQGAYSIGGTAFLDDGSGAGGIRGNGAQDGSEAGEDNVTVTLYYDKLGDGLTPDDIKLDMPTNATDGNGDYSFDGLPAGNYIVVVDKYDSDLTAGVAPTTTTERAVTIENTGVADVDFGFLPPLEVTKRVLGSDPYGDGETVSYELTVKNTIPSGISLPDGKCVYTVFPSGIDTATIGASWKDTSNMYAVDGVYGYTDLAASARDIVTFNTFVLPSQYDGNITNVAVRLLGNKETLIGDHGVYDSYWDVERTIVSTDSTPLSLYNISALIGKDVEINNSSTPSLPVIGSPTISWTDIQNATLTLGAKKSGGSAYGHWDIDAVALMVYTDAPCPGGSEWTVNPVPLQDSFNDADFTFVSSFPQESGTSTDTDSGVTTVKWDNIGPLAPGQEAKVIVNLMAIVSGANKDADNTAFVAEGEAKFVDGRPANGDTDTETITLRPAVNISGVVFSDLGAAGGAFTSGTDQPMSKVPVNLWACVDANGIPVAPSTANDSQTCSKAGGTWQIADTVYTDGSLTGDYNYLFAGVPFGYYRIAVDESVYDVDGKETYEPVSAGVPGNPLTYQSCNPAGASGCTGGWRDEISDTKNLNNFIVISNDTDITKADFGFQSAPSVSGYVWNNIDGDSVIGSVEPSFANVTVTLKDTTGAVVATTTTDSNGYYQFTGLDLNRSYDIVVTQTTGDMSGYSWNENYEQDSSTNNTLRVTTGTNGAMLTDRNFGWQLASGSQTVDGTVYYDWDGNAQQSGSGEIGIEGVPVYLYQDTNNNGVVDAGETLVASTSTDGNGDYSFPNLSSGNYLAVVEGSSDKLTGLQQTQDPDLNPGVACVGGACDGDADIDFSSGNDTGNDFGYQPKGTGSIGNFVWKDIDGDGVQDGGQETGIPGVTVTLEWDPNGDGNYVTLQTMVTSDGTVDLDGDNILDPPGSYLFNNLPEGKYRVVVTDTDPDLPKDAFGNAYTETTPISYEVPLAAGEKALDKDFGFAAYGAIGDTIYWDANGNGDYDLSEGGIPGVTVTLYKDVNKNGVYDAGDTLYGTDTTDADGRYLFSNLPPDNYVVVVGTTVSGAPLTADPDADGAVCPAAGSGTVCDGQKAVNVRYGTSFMGADFGYQPSGVIGDQLWIDTDGDGQFDPGEPPLAGVTVTLKDSGGATVGTAVTDSSGQYSFANLTNGAQYTVEVNPADLPSGLQPTYDKDGGNDNKAIVTATTGSINDIDFGYQYANLNNSLSGTICQEPSSGGDGVCGASGQDSGVTTGETAFSGVPVYIYKWTDDGDGIVESGETALLQSTTTKSNGDYSFDKLPELGANEGYVISTSTPGDYLQLTTVAANTPADSVVVTSLGAYQADKTGISTSNTGYDFAYKSTVNYDYGDAPASYSTLAADNGPRHIVPTTPNLYIGTAPTTETDGKPSVNADGDGNDGITANTASWTESTGGGSVTVNVTGSGWLVAWFDFDGDGTFSGAGEMIINMAVAPPAANPNDPYSVDIDPNTAGVQSPTFNIPEGTFDVSQGYARFRLFPEKPAVPELAYKGTATNGEVEDIRFPLPAAKSVIGDRIWLDENGDGKQDAGEDGIPNATVTLYSCGPDGTCGNGDDVTVTTTTDANGEYLFKDVPAGNWTVSVTPPSGLQPTYDEDDDKQGANTANTTIVTVGSGVEYMTADFGYNWVAPTTTTSPGAGDTGAIGDRIWSDANGDGVQDPGEPGLSGVTVKLLTDDNGDGVYGGAGDNPPTIKTTDSAGNYIFTSISAGSYVVEVDSSTLPGGSGNWTATGDPDATKDGKTTAPVLLGPGDVYLQGDFGYQPAPASSGIVIGTVYRDVDADACALAGGATCGDSGDNVLNGGDTGIPSVTVMLKDDSGKIIATTVTDSSGGYTFSGVPNGNYTVVVTDTQNVLGEVVQSGDPDSTRDNQHTVAVSGAEVNDVNFGYTPDGQTAGKGMIGSTIFLDSNNSGDYNPGEGLEGVAVSLYKDGKLVAVTQTDENGQYQFGNLPAGDYEVRVKTTSLPNGGSGLTNTIDPNGGDDSKSVVTLTESGGVVQPNLTQNFGYTGSNTVSGTIWNDVNADGTKAAAETAGLSGVTVVLRDSNGNIVGTTTTNSSGDYSFGKLPDGTYTVEVTDEAGQLTGWWHSVGPNAGADDNSQVSGGYSVTVGGSQPNNNTADFGYYKDSTSFGGTLWDDPNNNGTLDSGEKKLAHYQVVLTVTYPNGEKTTLTTLTDANGDYRFDNVMLDENYNSVTGGPTYTITVPATGELVSTHTLATDSLNDGSGVPAADGKADDPAGEEVSGLVKGGSDFTRDFGFIGGATIGDRVWLDVNRDGIQSLNEPGLSGVTVNIYRDDGVSGFSSTGDTLVATVVTDGNGNYSFAGLPPGNYWVDVDETSLPSGLTAATADQGGDDALDSDLDAGATGGSMITVAAGQVIDKLDFGYVGTTPLIGDTIWFDLDNDGIQDAGEAGIKDVKVTITPKLGGSPIEVFTDAAGHYLAPVDAGEYTVTVTLPTDMAVSNSGTASKDVTVPADTDILSADFGLKFTSGTGYTIGDLIWEDSNGNGGKDTGENGIAGVTVDLYRDGIPVATTTTDANGAYLFNVAQGGTGVNYEVRVTDRSGILDGRTSTNQVDGNIFKISDLTGNVMNADFGYQSLSIGDRVWLDLNGDGVQTPDEPGMNGVEVELYFDSNGDGSIDSGSSPIRTETTGSDGRYNFSGLSAGNYVVKLADSNFSSGGALENFSVTTANAGGDDAKDSDDTGSHEVAVTLGASSVSNTDFGFKAQTGSGSVSGLVWLDADKGGDVNSGENPIAEVTVTLYLDQNGDGKLDSGDQVLQTVLTDSTDSNYYFSNLPDGKYLVEISGSGLDGLALTTGSSVLPFEITGTTLNVEDKNFGLAPVIPTYALISSFKAYINDDNQTVLEWKTDSEVGTIGFLLERLNAQSGKYEAVTQELMPGMLTPPHGGEYRYVDAAAEPGKEHTYRVVEVAVNSQGAVAGPYTVRAEKPLPVNPAMQADGPEGFSLAHEPLNTDKQVRRAVLRKQAAKSLAAQVKKKTSKTLKVPVSSDGLVYLTADRIAAASGLKKQQVAQLLRAKKCLVTLEGKRVPALFAKNGAALWFYGQAPSRNDIGQNIYSLELGKRGAAIVTLPQAAGKVRTGLSFVHRERLEENHMPFHLYINKPVRDFWAWEYLLAHGKEAEVTHSIAAPSWTGSGSAALTVNLVNISSRSTGTAAPYKVTVSFNGTELGSEETAEIGDWQLKMDVPASLLRESGNEVQVVSRLNSGTVYSLIYLESFDLEYERKYEAADGELTFSSGQATKVTVEGFSTKNVLALDISNPVKPVRLRTAVSKSTTVADGFAVTVRTKPGRSYFITENLAAADAETVTADSPSQLRSGKNRADYLIIAPLHLLDSARRLAEHRQSQGLASMVVDIEDVQDEFSHGLAAPEAVHDFLAHVHEKWAQAPRYVALVGDGSYDYRNHLGYGWPVIPSVLVATPEGFFPSDNALADVAGNDGVPEFAVGRIPVFDKAEFDRYIDKVISYELSAGSGSMTVVNDKNDPAAGNFKASAELVAGFAPEQMTVSKLDVDSLGVTAVHDRIKTAMQQGTGILHYIGHSSLIGFGKGNGLLSAKNIEELNPAGQPTLMVSMSCSAASFGYPAMNSIGESAVLRADGAAVGFFGATGLSFNHLGDIIAEGFYRSLFDQAAAPRLGDAVLESKRHYRQVKQGDDAATMDIYNLLGDPAVRMPALP
ncbi:SdrD B-like domain-containing protein [Candidatus Electronema sp. JC]|uniref:SdrD B-like domain-containing protein n=1 Tax=Candidatus Electronema sp. JC TaxID=3401570 RepID=UPI003B43CE09